jgi:hypothetical protein
MKDELFPVAFFLRIKPKIKISMTNCQYKDVFLLDAFANSLCLTISIYHG